MKADKKILIAFLLNLAFSIFEFLGGLFTNSVAIISDSIHDIGDAISIGVAYFLEKKSKKEPDDKYTFGYARFSVLGATITTLILFFGSIFVILNAINRIIHPVPINYDGMIVFAIIGVLVNLVAAYFTKDGHSINQKSVNLHMLEDVLGWIVVLIGAIIIKFTEITIIDAIMSIAVAIFILYHAVQNLKSIVELFLVKTPEDISVSELKEHLSKIPGVKDIHHIHIWSMDGYLNYAMLNVFVSEYDKNIKRMIREELLEHGIVHATIELLEENEKCEDMDKHVSEDTNMHHHHHHHHHHH